MQVVPNDGWEGYSYSTPTESVFVSFPVAAGKLDRTLLPYCARVLIEIKTPNHNGGPTGEESKALWSMEDDLGAALQDTKVGCVMVGRLTHGGTRELVFQLNDWTAFRPVVGRWMQQNLIYNIDVSEHDGWDFFDKSIQPSEVDWQLIMDTKVVDRLIESGSDPKKPHEIEFVFIGPQESLVGIESRLGMHGYQRVSLGDQTLVTAKDMELDVGRIFSESRRHLDLAKEFGIKYDGWGASVVS